LSIISGSRNGLRSKLAADGGITVTTVHAMKQLTIVFAAVGCSLC